MGINQAPLLTTAGNGMAVTDFGPLSAQARSVVLQADGKVVVAGYAQDIQSGAYSSELVRYNADGSIDTTFGVGGIVSSGPSFATGSGVAVQADGKIVTAGAVFGSPNHFALARYNSDGSFDTSFGTGGKIVTDFGSTVPFGLLIQPDGKIVLTGGAAHAGGGSDFAVARFNIDGSFDTSFGTAGKVTTDFGGTYAAGYGIARTPDGKIVVGGIKEFVGIGFNYDFAVARYNDDGSLDTSFGAGGKVTTDFASTNDIPYSVAVQADGKIVLAGVTDPGIAANFGIVRYNVDGSLDASFGSGGKVSTDFGANFEPGNGVTIQADGKIVVAGFTVVGNSNADFALARYNSDGSLDTSFGTGGKVKTGFGSNSEVAISVVMQPDGKIVVTGSTASGVPGSGADYATMRYNSDGSLDTSFGVVSPLGGSAFFTEGGAAVVLNARAAVHDADLDTAGSYAGASLTLARHGGADAHDVFGASGNLAALTEGGNIVLSGVAIGTVSQNSGGTLILTFGANATEARVNEAMRDITYANSSDNPAASVQVDWSFSDGNTGTQGTGGALAATGSTALSITAVNDAPTVTILGQPQVTNEDTNLVFSTANGNAIAVADADAGAGIEKVSLSVLHGSVQLTSGGVTVTGGANGSAAVTFTGTVAQLNAALDGLIYRGVQDYNGGDTLTVTINDNGNAGTGGASTATRLVPINITPVNDAPSISVVKTAAGAIARVSTSVTGGQGDIGNSSGSSPVFSPDGTKIAFYSDATNLVAGDTNGSSDIFVKDLVTGAITRVSTDATGAQGNGFGQRPKFSPDGSKIAFDSNAPNLVPGDNNSVTDVFVKDLASGAITGIGGTTVGGPSYGPVFSPDGNKIAFYSYASNLAPNDLNNTVDVFIKNLTTGAITLVSANAVGVGGDNGSIEPVFSPDGSKVAFFSFATNLVAGDSNGVGDIFVKDLASGQVTRVSTAANGAQGDGSSSEPVFSPDGSKIAFFSSATNLVAGDSNGFGDAFVKDLATGAITRVSTTAAGLQGLNGSSFGPVFSPDGSKIAFFSDANNLVGGDGNGNMDVFVKDLVTGAITRVSTDAAGAQASQASLFPTFSPDGGRIAFFSFASDLVTGDSNNAVDLFVKNLVAYPEDPAAYVENASAVHVATASVTVTDVDNATFGGGSLTAALTAGSHAGDNLTLIATATPGAAIEVSGSTVKYNGAAIGTLSGSGTASLAVALNGSATAAAVQALAAAVGFASTSDDPTTDARTVTFTLVDGSGTANGGHDTGSFTQTVNVTPVNDAPVNTVPGSLTVPASADYAIAGLSVSDPDSASLKTILSVDHGTLTVAPVGGVTVVGSGTSVVTLTGSDAQIDAALGAAHNVVYHSAQGFNGADKLTMVTFDGNVTAGGAAVADLDVVAINVVRKSSFDFNGDGKSDILWHHDNGTTVIFDMNDSQILGANVVGQPSTAWKIAGTGDFNGDGNSDILWHKDDGTTVIFDMNGSQILSANVVAQPSTAWKIAGTGDFNGDGNSDILWHKDDGTTVIFDMNDSQILSANVVGQPSTDWKIAGTGDFNGDGKSDILWHKDDGTTVIFDMNDSQILSANVVGQPSTDWKVAGTGDFNGDGMSDILWHHDNGTTVIFDMNDSQVLSANVVAQPSTDWHIV